MAHVAVPDDEGGVGLDHLELMLAVCWGGHGSVWCGRTGMVDNEAGKA